MTVERDNLKACKKCGVIWNTQFHHECPNGHREMPEEIDWDR